MNQIVKVEDRLGHDFRYAINPSKINRELGWEAKIEFKIGLEKTIHWYLNKIEWSKRIMSN